MELLEAYNNINKKLSTSEFINNINLLIYRLFIEHNCSTLIKAYDKCLDWAKCYGALLRTSLYAPSM